MTPEQARDAVAAALAAIAPEVDLDGVDPDGELGEELDLDSMDLLELRTALQEATAVEIPADDPTCSTLSGLVRRIVTG
jgi:acyl carrier protein